MELLEETVATATGLKERKVLIEDQSFIFVPSPSSTSLGSKIPQTGEEKHELMTVANSRSKVLVIPDYVHNSNVDDSPPSKELSATKASNVDALANIVDLPHVAVDKPKELNNSKGSASTKSESLSSSPPSGPKELILDSPLTDVEFLPPLMLEILDVQVRSFVLLFCCRVTSILGSD
jgi:hypothetical protein